MAVDAQLIAWFERLGREFGPMPDASPASRRQRYEDITGLLAGLQPRTHVGIRNFHLALPGRTLDARLYHPGGTPALMVFFHGGGWVVGSIHSHDQLCAHIAAKSGVAILSVDYRLAPEHAFPAQNDDAYAAVVWAAAHGDELACDVKRLAVGGDSAGAHMAAVTALHARDRLGPAIQFQWLLYPTVEPESGLPSMSEFAAGPGLTLDDMRWFWAQLGTDLKAPGYGIAPSRAASFANLPAAYVLTAEADLLRDEGERLAMLLAQAGNSVVKKRGAGMTHGFARLFPICGMADTLTSEAASILGAALARVDGRAGDRVDSTAGNGTHNTADSATDKKAHA